MTKPNCFGDILAHYDYDWSNVCQSCQFRNECEIEAERAEEEYRYRHRIPSRPAQASREFP